MGTGLVLLRGPHCTASPLNARCSPHGLGVLGSPVLCDTRAPWVLGAFTGMLPPGRHPPPALPAHSEPPVVLKHTLEPSHPMASLPPRLVPSGHPELHTAPRSPAGRTLASTLHLRGHPAPLPPVAVLGADDGPGSCSPRAPALLPPLPEKPPLDPLTQPDLLTLRAPCQLLGEQRSPRPPCPPAPVGHWLAVPSARAGTWPPTVAVWLPWPGTSLGEGRACTIAAPSREAKAAAP